MPKNVRANKGLGWFLDPLRPTSWNAQQHAFKYTGGQITWLLPIAIGVALLVVAGFVAAMVAESRAQFFFSFHIAWVFSLSICIGAMFFVLIQHLTQAQWSTVVRRITESLMWGIPVLAVFGGVMFIGMHDLYHWTHAELLDPNSPDYDYLIAKKVPYLNVPFFVARYVIFFAVWIYIAYRLYTLSIDQDLVPGSEANRKAKKKVSAWGLPVMAVTTAFGSYDYLMSLDPHWFSTIFGVYFFGGAFSTAIALTAFMAMLMQKQGMLKGIVTAEHYQDLGKFMFGFTVFWAYIAFSQYMLIWYANIPEETIWYRHRLEHGWEYLSASLLIFHFILPFFILISKGAKRIPVLLATMTVWFVVMQWIDMFWLAAPVLHKHHATFHWLDFACWFGMFGLFFGLALYRLSRHSLVPQNDMYLKESLHFMNA